MQEGRLLCWRGIAMRLGGRWPVLRPRSSAWRIHASLRDVHAPFHAVETVLVHPNHVIDVKALFSLLGLGPVWVDMDEFAVRAMPGGHAAAIGSVHAVGVGKARVAGHSGLRDLPRTVLDKTRPDGADGVWCVPTISCTCGVPTGNPIFQSSQTLSQ